MIEKTLKTTTGKITIRMPVSLNEITLSQMMKLQEKPELNDLEVINILSGISLKQLQNVLCMDDFHPFADVILSLSEQVKGLYNNDAVPKKITFQLNNATKTINVIQNLSVEPAGAFMAARDIISDEINKHITQNGQDNWEICFNPSLKACCQVLAHYFYCRVTGKLYNEYEAQEFCTEIKKLRVTEALPVAKHFFTCYPNLSKQKTNFFQYLLHRLRKRPASRHLKNLNISIP